jgi:hypothetical protein
MAAELTMAVLLAAGCASAPPAPPAKVPLNDDSYSSIKSVYLGANPNARVGRVAAVLAGENRLSVGDVNLSDFRKGDVISVVDERLNPIADGTVVDIDSDYLYVQYQLAGTSGRSPAAGDLAIRAEAPTR